MIEKASSRERGRESNNYKFAMRKLKISLKIVGRHRDETRVLIEYS